MRRRGLALLLALALTGLPAAPLVATARAGCGRCTGAARCCCAAARGPGGCRIVRSCGAASGAEGTSAPRLQQDALLEAVVTARVPPSPSPGVLPDPPFEPADLRPVPPDPPPRLSL